MADEVKNIVLRFTGESEEAKGDIEALFGLLAAFDHVDVDAEAHVATAGAKADIAELFALLKLLDDTDVHVDVDVQTQKLSLAARMFKAFGITTGEADKGVEEFSSAISRLNVNLPGALGRLNAVSGAAFALAIAIGVQLVGALGALVASLGAAIAGLAALGVAFAGALGPAVLLVIGVVQRLTAVWKVLKQEDQAQLDKAQQRIQGEKAVARAQDQQRQAALQLQRANEDLGQATEDAYRQMEDAAQRATDAILALQRAQLGKQEAALGIKEAELELKKFIADMKVGQKEAAALFKKFTDVAFDPSKLNKELAKVKQPGVTGLDKQEQELKLERLIFNVKDARLQEKEATNQVTHAITEKSRADQDNAKFVQEGIKASPRYIAALRAIADAHRQVAQAQRAVKDAEISSSVAKTQAMTKQLSAQEKILLGILKDVRQEFKNTFGPGIQAIIVGIAVGLKIIGQRIGPLKSAFTTLGAAISGGIITVIDRLTSPQNIQAITAFANAGTQLIGPLVDIFTGLLQVLLNIGQAALPLLLPLVQNVATWFRNLADSTSGITQLQGIIVTLVTHFLAWWDVIKAVGGVLLEFFKQAAPFGLILAHAISRAANAFLAWMQSKDGREEIKQFLQTAVPFAIRFAHFIAAVVAFFIRLGEIAAPLLGPLLDIFTAILGLSTHLLRVFARLAKAVGDLANHFTHVITLIIDKLGKFVDRFINLGADFIAGIIKGIARKAGDLLGAVGRLAKKVLDKIKHPWKIISPSKVTQGYGEQLVNGLIVGMERASKDLSLAVKTHITGPVLDPLHVGVRAAPAAAAAAANVGAGGGRGDIIIEKQDVILPEPASGVVDPRAGAVQIARELRRSGRRGRRD